MWESSTKFRTRTATQPKLYSVKASDIEDTVLVVYERARLFIQPIGYTLSQRIAIEKIIDREYRRFIDAVNRLDVKSDNSFLNEASPVHSAANAKDNAPDIERDLVRRLKARGASYPTPRVQVGWSYTKYRPIWVVCSFGMLIVDEIVAEDVVIKEASHALVIRYDDEAAGNTSCMEALITHEIDKAIDGLTHS